MNLNNLRKNITKLPKAEALELIRKSQAKRIERKPPKKEKK